MSCADGLLLLVFVSSHPAVICPSRDLARLSLLFVSVSLPLPTLTL